MSSWDPSLCTVLQCGLSCVCALPGLPQLLPSQPCFRLPAHTPNTLHRRLYEWLLHDAQLGYTAEEEQQTLQLLEQLRAVLQRQPQGAAAADGELQQLPSPQAQLLQQAAAAGAAATEAALMQQYERIPAATTTPRALPPSATDSMLSDSETM